ncbi:MAG: DNA adenine methylase [Chloroflexi bacterium]|nr:DNA adenine methylase [Chloroflexota bacterium]
MKVPHPIPYQGSKRNIAKYILPFFPHDIATLVEPFAGSAAISIAAACYGKASRFHLNDLNKPLMTLWHEIINNPQNVAEGYARLWKEQQGNERKYYDQVRDEFNRTKRPEYLLYLLARCVKASVRYNPKGEFNQSPDNRRLGREPRKMADDIFAVSNILRGRTKITSKDFKDVLQASTPSDLIYMDPPYQGVCSNGDTRYYGGVSFDEMMRELELLNCRQMSFILSYDGRTGDKAFGKQLPRELGLLRIEVDAGRSTQSTLLGGDAITYESVYLSKALAKRLDLHPRDLVNRSKARPAAVQLAFVTS